ncbi:MAG: hypothetical protein ACFB51_19015 [Anaerolineae bacterium]
MPIVSDWFDEDHTILFTQVSEPFTWDDYSQNIDRLLALLDSVTHPVILLTDYTQVETIPTGALPQLSVIANLIEHPNFQQFVVYGHQTAIGQTATRIFERVYGRVDMVEDQEEALALIERIRRSDGEQ